MLKNQNIICFSSIDWDFIWQGHQEIMSTLAQSHNRVLFVENTGVRRVVLSDLPRLLKRIANWRKGIGGIRREQKNLYVYSPIVLPFPYSKFSRWINSFVISRNIKRWMRTMDFDEPIAWVFLPTGTVLSVLRKMSIKLLLYYCIDDFSKSSKFARRIVRTEKELLEKADIVFATSEQLYQKSKKYNRNVFSFPFGVNLENFKPSVSESMGRPEELVNLKDPIIGYIGGIHRWIDQELIKETARRHPDCNFVFVGPIQIDIKELSQERNIFFLGQKPREKLPQYVHYFSVCLIPYQITPYTGNVYPTKLNEYLALGKPVLSTPLPEIVSFNQANGNIIKIAKTAEEFSRQLGRMIHDGVDNMDEIRQRIETAIKNGWSNKIEKMSDYIEKYLNQKLEQQEAHWRENLFLLYHKARKKIIRTAMIVLGSYFLIFHTPLFWWLAEPLRRSDPIVQSDLIIVLGGGVGESGLAGEGYQERVQKGIELYSQGYGGKILFSSGYRYSFQEVEVMKALAVELGIPREKILLEKRPINTYDHIVYAKETLQKNSYDSVIIVSSPYHMGRVNAVSQKILSGYKVSLAPVENSIFFGKRSSVKLRHIRAVLHEYLALLYYAYKGYL